MLIKKSDNRDKDISELRQLLEYEISAKQRSLVEREIKILGSGIKGEESSAYYIDFQYKNSKNWAIIHDLRLEHQGFVAQIDHLLINRFLDIYVLESKNYYYGIKISPLGEFSFRTGKTYIDIESPVEQNRRHISLLEKKLAMWSDIMPTRLGIPMPATFHNYVLVAPNSSIDRPSRSAYDTSIVIKADALVEAINKQSDGLGMVETFASAAKMISVETLETFAESLAKLHRPAKIDYAGKFGIRVQKDKAAPVPKPIGALSDVTNKNKRTCNKCGIEVDSKVVNYCSLNKEKFGGQIFCRSCQRTASTAMSCDGKSQAAMESAPEYRDAHKQATCEKCKVAVDSKVLFFCRMNKQKFGGNILCRECQVAYTKGSN